MRKTYSDEVSAKALKNVLIPGQQSDYNERRKLKQDVFIDGKFEDICELLEKPGPDLNEHLSVLFKNFGLSDTEDDHEGLERSSNDANDKNYAVMTDSEPYMKFCPQIFMYWNENDKIRKKNTLKILLLDLHLDMSKFLLILSYRIVKY